MKGKILNIVYSSDDKYAIYMGVSIYSVLKNNIHFDKINFYIIDNGISNTNKEKLCDLVNEYKRNIEFFDFNSYKDLLILDMEWEISISAYGRLFIQDVLPTSVEKVLYLDCDTLIINNLDEVWESDINNYYIAGVLDTASSKMKHSVNLNSNSTYINSGMILINLNEWRKDKVKDLFLNFINQFNGKVIHHDQGVINGVLNKKIKVVSPKFNLMTNLYMMKRKDIIEYYDVHKYYNQDEIDISLHSPVIIHYTPGFTTRPWIKGCKHPKVNLFLQYLSESPWNDMELLKDERPIYVKVINWMYLNLNFNLVNFVCKKIFKIFGR